MKNLLIQKFGGTSLASRERQEQAIKRIQEAKDSGFNVVVVVSAMGREGDPYATDTLIGLAKEAGKSVDERELDLIMSCGEIISGVVLTTMLNQLDYKTSFLTGFQAGIITDKDYNNASILKIEPSNIKKLLQEDKIVVVAGFQGITSDGEITTLGRGGSDTTATALGVTLNAEAVEIYTDVDGVKAADPKIVDDAKTLETLSYSEVCQLAYAGAKVVHPRAVEIAMKHNIPIKVKSTFSDAPGTLVTNDINNSLEFDERLITGITQISSLTQLKIDLSEVTDEKIQLKIFKALALAQISVDFINIFVDKVIFCVEDNYAEKAVNILQNMDLRVQQTPGCAKIAAVGAGLTGVPGIMAKIVEALSKEGIDIIQSADSHTSVWCLVKREEMENAVKALYHQFELNK